MGEDVAAQPDTQPRRRRLRRLRRMIASGAATLLVVAVVAALGLLFWLRPIDTPQQGISPLRLAGAPQQLVSTAGWQPYTDPRHLFSIQVPASWSVQQDEGSGSFGNRNGSYSFTSEVVWLGVPPENIDGLGVWLNVVPLTTDFARQSECTGWSGRFAANSSLATVPAYYDGHSMWMVDTHTAHFQINAHYPGGPQSPHSSPRMTGPPPTPTPVPADQVSSGQEIIGTVLATFTLTNPTPLGC